MVERLIDDIETRCSPQEFVQGKIDFCSILHFSCFFTSLYTIIAS